MKLVNVYILFFLSPLLVFAQPKAEEIDKLLANKDFRQQLTLLDSISLTYRNENPSLALLYANKEVEIATNNNDEKLLAQSLSTRSKVLKQLTDFDKAEIDLNQALTIYTKLNYKSGLTNVFTDLGTLNYLKGNFDAAIKFYLNCLKIADEVNDKSSQASVLNNIGNVYLMQQKEDKAIVYYQKAYELYKVLGDLERAALTLDNIGLVYSNKDDYQMALLYQVSALRIVEKLSNQQMLAETLMNVGALYQLMEKYDAALKYFEQAYEISVKIDSKYTTIGCLINIGEAYKLRKNYELAISKTMEAYAISQEMGAKANLKKAAINLSDIYEELKQYDNALKYYKIYSETKDSILNEESFNQINELSAKYEADKKQKEIEILTKDNDLNDTKLKQQKTLTISLFIGIGLIVIMLLLVFYRYQEKRKANVLLEEKNSAINEQKELVVEKNKEITDSINYARRIQDAMLPSQKIVNEYFKDNFIFYQPKDIISGDFYWALRKDDKLYIAAADCTGHGVPGALMSMIGVTFLRQIINEMNITHTAEILNHLHSMVLSALNEDVNFRNSQDGMDVALLKIDLSNKKAQFSGAVRPLYVATSTGFEIIKGDRFSIGGIKTLEESFSSVEIDWLKGTSFYLFSDGLADQFGQQSCKKFKVKKLQDLLTDLNHQPMQEQYRCISELFNDWKGNLEQTDDVLLIGIKV